MSAPVITTPQLGRLNTAVHKPNSDRPCVHALTTPPGALLVDRAAVEHLNCQARVIEHGAPIIAARQGDTLLLAVDILGDVTGRHPKRDRTADQRSPHQWAYTLHPIPGNDDQLLAIQDTTTSTGRPKIS